MRTARTELNRTVQCSCTRCAAISALRGRAHQLCRRSVLSLLLCCCDVGVTSGVLLQAAYLQRPLARDGATTSLLLRLSISSTTYPSNTYRSIGQARTSRSTRHKHVKSSQGTVLHAVSAANSSGVQPCSLRGALNRLGRCTTSGTSGK